MDHKKTDDQDKPQLTVVHRAHPRREQPAATSISPTETAATQRPVPERRYVPYMVGSLPLVLGFTLCLITIIYLGRAGAAFLLEGLKSIVWIVGITAATSVLFFIGRKRNNGGTKAIDWMINVLKAARDG
jgi:hypothetical protein